MTTSMADYATPKLDMGRVAQQTFQILGRQPVAIFGLALLLAGIPAVVNLYFASEALRGVAAGGLAALQQFGSVTYWLRNLASLFIGAFLGATLFFVVFSEISGRKASPSEILSNGAKLFLPLFAVNLLSAIAVILGLILLIVPGIMIAIAWCVAGPALVAERTGITQVFGRSAQLTGGNRWRIFALVLIYVILIGIIEGVVGAIAGGGIAVFSPARIGITAIFGAVNTAITYTGLAVLYTNLRELKEGVGGESLAAVFD